MRKISLLLLVLVYSQAFAQGESEIISTLERLSFNIGSFAIAVTAGIILALAFQLLFTNISIAAGLSVAGTAFDRNNKNNKNANESSGSVHSQVRKLSGAFGLWTMISAGISLFFAIWISVTLSVTTSELLGALTGLVVWGLFYVITMRLEANAVSSLVGTIFNLAGSGLRSAFEGTKSIFTKSETSKQADITKEITAAVKDELFSDLDADELKTQINSYIKELKPREINPEEIRMEMEKFFDDMELSAIAESKGDLLQDEEIEASLKRRKFNRRQAKSTLNSFKEGMNIIREERRKNKTKAAAGIDAGMRMTGMSGRQAEENRHKIEEYLRNTGKEELNPDGIKRDLEKLFSNPKEGSENLQQRLSAIDRETIASIISRRSDISEEEAMQKINAVESTINKMSGKAADTKTQTENKASMISGKASMLSESAGEGISQTKEKTKAKVEEFIGHLSRPEFNFDDMKRDFQKIFGGEVKSGSKSMLRRLKAIDRETIKEMLSYRDDISEEDAERIISNIENKRDEYIRKAEEFTNEVKRRVEAAKEEAIHQADEVRKTAASAAWWAAATAGVSAFAAVLGGLIGAL